MLDNKSGRNDSIKMIAIGLAIYYLFFYNGGIIFPDNPQGQTIQASIDDGSVTYVTTTVYNSEEDNQKENINNISHFDEFSTTIIVGDTDNTLELTRYSI